MSDAVPAEPQVVENPVQRFALAPAVVTYLAQIDEEITALRTQKDATLSLLFAQAGVTVKTQITGFDPQTGEILYTVA